jgi:hypothetical protein
MDYPQAYALLFNQFVEERNLDLDDTNWSENDKLDWAERYGQLQTEYRRIPLL